MACKVLLNSLKIYQEKNAKNAVTISWKKPIVTAIYAIIAIHRQDKFSDEHHDSFPIDVLVTMYFSLYMHSIFTVYL